MLPPPVSRIAGCLLLTGSCVALASADTFETPETGLLPKTEAVPSTPVSWVTDDSPLGDFGSDNACNAIAGDPCCAEMGGLYAGFAFVFAKPYLKESFKAFAVDLPTATQHLFGFDHPYDLSPRVWLGYQASDGFGIRARYWQYDQDADPLALVSSDTRAVAAQTVTVVFPGLIQSTGPGQVLTVGNGLRVQTIDLEGTEQLSIGTVQAVFGMGVRYATLGQSFQAAISEAGVPVQLLASRREFEGFGPIVSGEFRRPLGRSGLGAFASVSGGILFGTKSMRRSLLDAQNTFPPIISMDRIDEVTGMGDLQIGLEWSRCSPVGRVFVRGSYEAQLWTDAGAPTLTFLGFEGFAVSLGLLR